MVPLEVILLGVLLTACRRCLSPKGLIWDRHSDLIGGVRTRVASMNLEPRQMKHDAHFDCTPVSALE
jgi:hypothetical protein